MQEGVLQALRTDPGDDRIREVYVLTDGFIGNDDEIVGAAKGALGKSRLFTVGIGSAPNRALLGRLAQVGRGFASYLNLTENADDVASTIVARAGLPYLTDIAIDWGGLDVFGVSPAAIPDVFAGQPLVLSGRYHGPGVATVRVSANHAGRRVTIPVSVTLPFDNDLEPVASLWARRQIDGLELDKLDGKGVDDQITKLGLEYHLVTELTSFVAVDQTRVIAPGGATKIVTQPAAVPAGVNIDTAVGPAEASAPSRSSSSSDDDCCSGGGGWGGGDVDLSVLIAALALLPLAIVKKARG